MGFTFARGASARFAIASFLVIITVLFTLAQPADAIDLRSLPNNFGQGVLGQPTSDLYAQSVIAEDLYLIDARVIVRAYGGSNLLFNFLITGDRADISGGFAPDLADIRFNSGMITALNGDPLTEYAIAPNLPVTPGERLFLVFDSFSYPTSGFGDVFATQFNAAVDPYVGGEFMYFNAVSETNYAQVNAASWTHRGGNNQDLAILAAFSSVPEPTTLSLLAIGGGAMMLKRRLR